MRNQWRRLLFQRCNKVVSTLQHKVVQHSSPTLPKHTPKSLIPRYQYYSRNRKFPRTFSSFSQPIFIAKLIKLYSDPLKTNEDVMLELYSKKELANALGDEVIGFFKNRGSDPLDDRMFYDWVMKGGINYLNSNICNHLLGMLGGNGLVKEFWELAEVMKKKGYGVKKGVSDRAMAKFEEQGLGGDMEKLKDLIALGPVDASALSTRVCRVIGKGPWGDDVETKLKEMGVVYTSLLVKLVLEKLGTNVKKAVIFFRWIEGSGLYKHDEVTYNAIVRELAQEECMDKIWSLIYEMRAKGFDLEKDTYSSVLLGFTRKKMFKDAIDLYEFAMGGNTKPSFYGCIFLVKDIIPDIPDEKLDMDSFLRVLKIYKDGGNNIKVNVLTMALISGLKSLTSVGRFNECNNILRAVEEASANLDFIKVSNAILSVKSFVSLIDRYCYSGNLDKACELIEKQGSSYAVYALETLIKAYCANGKSIEAYKLLSKVVIDKQVKPWHTTYKLLICKLLDQGLFKEATNLFAPMKANGYPPYLDPFVKYVAKKGTTDEVFIFLKAATYNKVPSIALYMRVITAYLKAGRHHEAQEFLSKCPRYIQNHVDVLNLFFDMKCVKDTDASTPVVLGSSYIFNSNIFDELIHTFLSYVKECAC